VETCDVSIGSWKPAWGGGSFVFKGRGELGGGLGAESRGAPWGVYFETRLCRLMLAVRDLK